MPKRTFFVRHGEFSSLLDGSLTETGREQAAIARDLLAEEVGREALLLTTPVKRAVETAEILHGRIGDRVRKSTLLADISFEPGSVQDLNYSLEIALRESGAVRRKNDDLVVVSHNPLMAALKDGDEEGIGFGEIVEFDGNWPRRGTPGLAR